MDIELARTFLTVAETGNFNRAAAQLNVTQSTVSMRVKALEDLLGRSLFTRGRGGAILTAAGEQFLPYAGTLLRAWQQARMEVGLPEDFVGVLAVGSETSLWGRLVLDWMAWMRGALPDVAVRAEVGPSDRLMGRLVEGLLDIAVMYTPQTRPGIVVEDLLTERLVPVRTDVAIAIPDDARYVYVDWGPEFRTGHATAFPDCDTPALSIGHGPLALDYILANGGAGYFPARAVASLIAECRLQPVPGLPDFARPVHLVYLAGRDDDRFAAAVDGLRLAARREAGS